MTGLEDRNIKHCGKCGQKIPNGLLVCVRCAVEASGADFPEEVANVIEVTAQLRPGGITHAEAMQEIRNFLPVKPRKPREREPWHLLDGVDAIHL